MSKGSDRRLGMNRAIARRDFLQGVAVGVTFGSLAPELAEAADQELVIQEGRGVTARNPGHKP